MKTKKHQLPPKSTKKHRPSPKVTHIEISRVYNTGNYTNVKYSLGVEVPKGASPKATLFELVHIMTMLKPFSRPRGMKELEDARKKTAEEQTNYEKEHLEQWMQDSQEYHQKCADRQAALASLDDLGGAIEKRDAKSNWNDYDDDTPW